MKGFLSWIRGVIKTGLTWAVGWIVLLSGVFGILAVVFGEELTISNALRTLFGLGFLGFLGGSAFAVILSIAERRRSLGDLSVGRTAVWGGLGGFLVASALNLFAGGGALVWPFVGALTLFGAGSSAGTIALAKRGADIRLLEAGDEDPGRLEGE